MLPLLSTSLQTKLRGAASGWRAGTMTVWGEKVSISSSLPRLSIPLCLFQRTFKGRRPLPTPFPIFRGLFTFPVSPCTFCGVLEAHHAGEADRSPRCLRVHTRKQGFEIAGCEASGLAKPTPQPAPSLHELVTPKLPRGGGHVEREPIVRGGRSRAQHRLGPRLFLLFKALHGQRLAVSGWGQNGKG